MSESNGAAFDDYLYEEVVKSRSFFFAFIREVRVAAAFDMRQRAVDTVKNLSNEDGLGMGSARVEEAIRSLKIQGEDD